MPVVFFIDLATVSLKTWPVFGVLKNSLAVKPTIFIVPDMDS